MNNINDSSARDAEIMTEEKRQRRRRKLTIARRILLIILLAAVTFLFIDLLIALFSMPKPQVDYVALANELTRPPDYDPNNNAAADYAKAFPLLVEQPDEVYDLRNTASADMNDSQRQLVTQWVTDNNQALIHVEKASLKPYYWFEYQGDSIFDVLLEPLSDFKAAAYVLVARAKLKAAEGDVRGALTDMTVCYRTGQHLAGKKMFVEQLVGLATRALAIRRAKDILAKTDPDPKTLQWLADELNAAGAKDDRAADLTIERLGFLDILQQAYNRCVLGNDVMSIKAAFELRTSWTIAGKDQTLAAYDELCDYYAQCALKKLYDLNMSGKTLDAMIEEKGRENKLLLAYMPSLSRANELWVRERADTDALLTVIALLRYKREHGQCPQTLQKLVEIGFLNAIPQDPFGPGPLTYINRRDDFTLYSWGSDMDDDGGAMGVRIWDIDGGDAVFWPVDTTKAAVPR